MKRKETSRHGFYKQSFHELQQLVSSNAPSIPLFGDAYLADTRHLSLEEHGAYLQLMMIAWRSNDCALPNDDARLCRMLGITAGRWAKLKPIVMAFWSLSEKGWTQKRLSKERAFVEEKRSKNKSAAEARWSGQVIENKQPDGCGRISERNAPPPPPPKIGSVAKATSPRTRKARAAKPDDVEPLVWSDFQQQRKTVFTETALNGMKREAEIAGISLNEALKESCARGWQSFKADWIRDKQNGRSNQNFGRGEDRRSPLERVLDREISRGYGSTDGQPASENGGGGQGSVARLADLR